MISAPVRRRSVLFALMIVTALVGCERGSADLNGSAVAARELGLAYLQLDRLDSAEVHFRRVVSLAPDEALGYANLGLVYFRGGRIQQAEEQTLRARALDSRSPTIALQLARIHVAQGRQADAKAILEPFSRANVDDPAALFALAALDSSVITEAVRDSLLRRIIDVAPTNLVVRMAQLDAFVFRGLADSATRALEEIRRLPPEPPAEAIGQFSRALPLLRAGRLAAARAPLGRFRQAMELTPAYQAGLTSIQSVADPIGGRPVLTFSPSFELARRATALGSVITDAVQFVDATEESGLGAPIVNAPAAAATRRAALAAADFDGDGIDDLFASRWDPATGTISARPYRSERGVFTDATAATGLSIEGGAEWAIFVDYDNDGRLDLFAIDSGGVGRLFRNTAGGRFEDVSALARVGDVRGARKALFVDLDHDGDLDIAAVGSQGVIALRNNSDGTFVNATAEFGLSSVGDARDLAFADFDGDGRIDLFVTREQGSNTLLRNIGARRFEDATRASSLVTSGGSGAVAVGDLNNDGALDLFVAAADAGAPTIWMNQGDGRFARDRRSTTRLGSISGMRVSAVQFADYDNDGWLDLVALGTPLAAGNPGTALLHNDGTGRFEDRTSLLPRSVTGGSALAVVDLGSDGDEDLLIASQSMGLRAIRNDGGNLNLFVQVRLVALRTGSGKNNDFGIGAKLELRAGDVVQTRVVTEAVTHFGLGAHLKADVLRLEWPNGVQQVIHFPGSDQDVLENEVLKSSCGFIYTWDGTRFRFATDIMWRSALGMPLGIMGSSTEWAPAGASQEYLRIAGDALQPRDGRYVLQLTEELWETAFVDEIRLIAVDHPDSVDVFVNERFVPPGPVELRMYQSIRPRPPRSAVDGDGNDLLPALRSHDDVYVSNLIPLEYQGLVESHDLVMDLGEDAGRQGSILLLRGWIYPTDASINVALSQQKRLTPIMPVLEVRGADGGWRPVADVGFPSGKDKTVVVDLAGIFPTKDRHVRIRTNLQIYWDQVAVATEASTDQARLSTLSLLSADLHFRGTSRTFRKGGRYGPHWFDYDDVTTEPVWRPITGAYTRFGDVLPLLRSSDDMYVVMAPGDEATLQFDAAAASPLPSGWIRSFLLYSVGWIKDADMNTAFGNTVGPLPFHAMRQYPYAPGEAYPTDPALERYQREYNTRVVRR